MDDLHNMRYYEQGRSVPKDALKAFDNGRFKGTDINPMWRIKKLTEMFGPCGIGWYTEVTRQEVVHADDDNMMVFVDVNLYVKEAGEWSKPIFGTGGNTLKVKGRGDDEGYKKAYTDAVSIACKALGIGADVWYANDTTSKYADKYVDGSAEAAQEAGKKKAEQIEQKLKATETPKEKFAEAKATREQVEYIASHVTDADMDMLMKKYGDDFYEHLTYAQAEKVMSWVDERNRKRAEKA